MNTNYNIILHKNKLQSTNFIKGDFVFRNSDVKEKSNVTCVAKLIVVDCKFFALE
jgi:hypothetical protein